MFAISGLTQLSALSPIMDVSQDKVNKTGAA